MRLLLDHCVSGRRTAEALRMEGIEALPLIDELPADSPDTAIIEHCGRLGMYLLTADTFRRGGRLDNRVIRAAVRDHGVGVFVYETRSDRIEARVAFLRRQRRRLLQADLDFANRRPFFAWFSRSKPKLRWEFLRQGPG